MSTITEPREKRRRRATALHPGPEGQQRRAETVAAAGSPRKTRRLKERADREGYSRKGGERNG